MKIAACLLLLFTLLPSAVLAAVAGDACITSGQVASSTNVGGAQSLLWCNGSAWQNANLIIGDTVSTCDATNRGALKYDGVSTWTFCNGTNFVPFNTVGGTYKTVFTLGTLRTNTTASTCTAAACAAGYTSKGCQWGDGNYQWSDSRLTNATYASLVDRIRDNGFNDSCSHTHENPNPSGEFNQSICVRLCAQ